MEGYLRDGALLKLRSVAEAVCKGAMSSRIRLSGDSVIQGIGVRIESMLASWREGLLSLQVTSQHQAS